jgi:translocation and assembly module TamA
VHQLDIVGNHAFSNGAIREGLATEKTGWWPFASRKPFDRAAFDVDLRRIVAFYSDRGYFDARILAQEVKSRPDGGVDIRIQIDEGKPTKIQKVELAGLPRKEEPKARRLAGRLALKEGLAFDYDKYASAKKSLENRLKQDGYAYAKVGGVARVDRDQRRADVEVKAEPGPEVRFGKVRVEGNGNIPAHAILNRVSFRQGDKFDPDDLTTTQGRLYELGVFGSVRLDLPPDPQPTADVVVHVTPGKLRELRLGGGFGAEQQRMEVRLRGEWSIRNFLGGLRTLRLRVRPAYVVIPSLFDPQRSGVAAQNDLQLTQPDIFGTSITVRGLVGYDLDVEPGYQSHGPRAQLAAERPFWRDRVLIGASWNMLFLDFFNIDHTVFNPLTTQLGFGFTDPYRVAYLEETGQLDLRDRPLDPRLGTYVLVRVEQGLTALGSDFQYFKITPEVRAYFPLGRRVVLAGRGLLGWLEPSSRLDSPITRRYALGGPSSHRGFGFGRLAPQAYSELQKEYVPLGGDGAVLLSGELRVQLFKVKGNWLRGVPFVDAGDVRAKVSDLGLSDLHIATGASLEYQTPIGPVRAGVGVRLNRTELIGPNGVPNPDPGQRYAIHLTIGEAF